MEANSIRIRRNFIIILLITSFLMITVAEEALGSTGTIKWTDGVKGGAIYFNPDTGEITGADENVTEITIPGKINGKNVASVSYSAFHKCNRLKKITIASSVKEIWKDRSNLFYCDALELIEVSENNKYYSSKEGILFNKSGTILIKCPDNYKSETLLIPDGVKKIKGFAFDGCLNIKKIILSKSVSNLDDGIKMYIGWGYTSEYGRIYPSLEAIEVAEGNKYFSSKNGVLYNKSGNKLVRCPEGYKHSSFIISEGVSNIDLYAFDNCEMIKTITIPSSVNKITYGKYEQERLYTGSNLEKIVVSGNNAVFSAKDGVLYNKKGNKLLQVPSGWKEKEFSIPESVTEIGYNAFEHCNNINTIIFSRNTKKLSDNCIFIPWSVSSFIVPTDNPYFSSEDGVLFNKKKTELLAWPTGKSDNSYSVPEGVKIINEHAFFDSDLKQIILPETVTEIEQGAFSGCHHLTSINIPKKVEVFGSHAFSNCSNLQKLNIPTSVSRIGWDSTKSDYNGMFYIQYDPTVIYCTAGSYAESYAKRMGYSYVSMKKPVLTVTSQNGNAKLSWKKVSNATKYQIYIYDSAKKKYVLQKTNSLANRTATHKGLVRGRTYKYKIRAYCVINGERVYSPFSDVKTVRIG